MNVGQLITKLQDYDPIAEIQVDTPNGAMTLTAVMSLSEIREFIIDRYEITPEGIASLDNLVNSFPLLVVMIVDDYPDSQEMAS